MRFLRAAELTASDIWPRFAFIFPIFCPISLKICRFYQGLCQDALNYCSLKLGTGVTLRVWAMWFENRNPGNKSLFQFLTKPMSEENWLLYSNLEHITYLTIFRCWISAAKRRPVRSERSDPRGAGENSLRQREHFGRTVRHVPSSIALLCPSLSLTVTVFRSKVRFMFDTLMAVKNNNVLKVARNYDPELLHHFMKLLRGFRKGEHIHFCVCRYLNAFRLLFRLF